MLFEQIVLFFLANRLTNQKELNFDFNLSNLPSILNLIEYQSPNPPHFDLVDFETKIPLKTVCHLSPVIFFVFSLLYQMPRELDWFSRVNNLSNDGSRLVLLLFGCPFYFLFYLLKKKQKTFGTTFCKSVYKLIQTHVGNLLLICFSFFI